jgi:hypothetical protein
MEEIGAARPPGFGQQSAPGIGRQRGAERAEKAMRPIAELKAGLGMLACQAIQNLAGI